MSSKKEELADNRNLKLAAVDGEVSRDSLETVRDILFGSQMRESNRRADDMEKTFRSALEQSRKEFTRQLSQLESTVQSLEARLTESASAESSRIDSRLQAVDESIAAMGASEKQARDDLFDLMTNEKEALEASVRQWNEDLAKQLDTINYQLQNSKTDRVQLASLLEQMADSLKTAPSPEKNLQ